MPSAALQEWLTVRLPRLDEIEDAHRSVGGGGPGRRYATQQINQAYAMLLSAQFQGFCRDLHTESVNMLARSIMPISVQPLLVEALSLNRKLDRGNPNSGNIGSDFHQLGVRIWPRMALVDSRNAQRQQLLDELVEWRNAIAHQDFDPARLGGTVVLRLERVRNWRGACEGLARSLDQVLHAHLGNVLGTPPW